MLPWPRFADSEHPALHRDFEPRVVVRVVGWLGCCRPDCQELIESSFGGVDPPTPSDDALRDAVLDAVGTAGDALSDARVAIRRDDMTALTEAGADLQAAQTALQSLRESLG